MASTQQLIEKLLEENGAKYEQAVVSQLNEYAFIIMKSLLQSAEENVTFSQRGEKKQITEQDLKQAMKIQENIQLEGQEQIASRKNVEKIQDILPNQKKNQGVLLPNKDTNMLLKNNYQLIITQQDQQEIKKPQNKLMEQEIKISSEQNKKQQQQSRLKIDFQDFGQEKDF